MSLDPNAALLINKRRSDRQGSETVTGVTNARQNQQQGQCTAKPLWRDETLAAQLLHPLFEILEGQRRRKVTLAGQRRCEVNLAGQRRREVTLEGQRS